MTKRPVNPVVAAYKSFGAAKLIGMPLWKVIPGLLTQWEKMYQLALFGGATSRIMAATVDGDLEYGVQFVGQSQGQIESVLTVDEVVRLTLEEAAASHNINGARFDGVPLERCEVKFGL